MCVHVCVCVMYYREVFMSSMVLSNKGHEFYFIILLLIQNWFCGVVCGMFCFLQTLLAFLILILVYYCLYFELYVGRILHLTSQTWVWIPSSFTSLRNFIGHFPLSPTLLFSLPTNAGLSNSKRSRNSLEILFLLIYPVFLANSPFSLTNFWNVPVPKARCYFQSNVIFLSKLIFFQWLQFSLISC